MAWYLFLIVFIRFQVFLRYAGFFGSFYSRLFCSRHDLDYIPIFQLVFFTKSESCPCIHRIQETISYLGMDLVCKVVAGRTSFHKVSIWQHIPQFVGPFSFVFYGIYYNKVQKFKDSPVYALLNTGGTKPFNYFLDGFEPFLLGFCKIFRKHLEVFHFLEYT